MTDSIQKTTAQMASNEGLPIRYDVYYSEENAPEKPLILFLHGFKGFKDWGTFPALCTRWADAGFNVIAMNFSLNGVGENPTEFDRLDLFARGTLSQDLDDVGSMIDAITAGKITAGETPLAPSAIGILGHSRGGQTAVAAAAEYENINCLVTWSAVADYNARWSKKMKDDWAEKGVTNIKNGRTGQIMPMKKVVYDDARENADRVIALHRAPELSVPALFVHSKGDGAVPHSNAQQLLEACASPDKELMLLEDTGHTFGGSHPFESDTLPAPLQKAWQKSANWFADHLK